jgi:hypothetical protein
MRRVSDGGGVGLEKISMSNSQRVLTRGRGSDVGHKQVSVLSHKRSLMVRGVWEKRIFRFSS